MARPGRENVVTRPELSVTVRCVSARCDEKAHFDGHVDRRLSQTSRGRLTDVFLSRKISNAELASRVPRRVFETRGEMETLPRFRLSSHTRPHPPKDFASARCLAFPGLAKLAFAIASGTARHTRTHPSPFTPITSKMAAFAATTPSLKVRPRVEPPRARGARATRVSGRDCRATRAKKSPIRVCRGGPSLGIAGVARARRRRDARD